MGYDQMALDDESIPKAAFLTPRENVCTDSAFWISPSSY